MPRSPTDTGRRIVDAACELFYEADTPAGVDAIADARSRKRTLYYRPSKDALLSAVLEIQHELMLAGSGGGSAAPDDPQR